MKRALQHAALLCTLLAAPAWMPVGQADSSSLPDKPLTLERHHPKVADRLLALADSAQTQGIGAAGGGVRVVLEKDGAGPSEGALRALGAVVEARSRSLLRVRLPPGRIVEAAELPGVRRVREPHAFRAAGAASQAVTPIGATLLHSLDVLGQGVKVAVIDIGFGSLDFVRDSGDLPAEVLAEVTDYSGQGDALGDHGTAVALIVHQVAPQARLYLKQVGDGLDLENAVDDAIRQGIQIVNHSVGWFGSNFGDGTGFFADLVQRAADAGILWVNAAGNHAQNHWMGRFVDADGDGWSDFPGSGDGSLRIAAYFGQIEVDLTWDDWPASGQDLDLYLYDDAGRQVAASADWQTGSEPPVETLTYLVLEPGLYHVRVFARRLNRPLRIKLFSLDQPLFPHTAYGSLAAPADAAAALTVGAVSVWNWPDGGPQEPFSSLGPTSDGRLKPDLVAPDMVRSPLFKYNPFSGTSASAPHVAGAAALLWSQHPDWDVFALKAALRDLVRDLGPPGADPVYGAGGLDLAAARLSAERALDPPRAPPGATVSVSVRVQIPPLVFGALEIEERPPPGWQILTDDPAFDPQRRTWRWPAAAQGQVVVLRYALAVPADVRLGRYALQGSVNGAPIGGDAQVEVVAAPPSEGPLNRNGSGLRVRRSAAGIELRVDGPPGLEVAVYDLAGRRLYEARTAEGALRWNGATQDGRTAANGVYLIWVTFADRSTRIVPVVWLR